MKRFKKVLASPAFTAVSLILAAILLSFSGIGGARAALQYYSDDWQGEVEQHDIGVTLMENGKDVSWRNYKPKGNVDDTSLSENNQEVVNWDIDNNSNGASDMGILLADLSKKGDSFKLDSSYPEVIAARNTGTIDEYVRITIHRYWQDPNGNKVRDTNLPDIDLNFSGSGNDWVEDKSSRTEERNVFYYTKLLPVGATTSGLTDKITLKAKDVLSVKTTVTGTTTKKITTEYLYNGYQFFIEAQVDAVQDHHADDAIWSAWGKEVSVDDSSGAVSLSGGGTE